MVNHFRKGFSVPLSPHFASHEFDCPCRRPECSETLIDMEMIEGLEVLRTCVGPLEVLSGYRCEAHNKEVGGEDHSKHPLGKGADVRAVKGYSGQALAREAERVSVFATGGIGIAERWCHVDNRDDGPARWVYPPKRFSQPASS